MREECFVDTGLDDPQFERAIGEIDKMIGLNNHSTSLPLLPLPRSLHQILGL